MISHEDIFRTGIALLAFVVAFYAVIARERKTPYILNSIYTITFLVLAALLLSLASKVAEGPEPVRGSTSASETSMPQSASVSVSPLRIAVAKQLNRVAVGILGFGIVFIFYRIWRIQNRQVNFRNDQLRFTIPLFLSWRKWKQKGRRQKAYEHNPQKLSPELIVSLKQSRVLPADKLELALKHNGDEQDFSTSAALIVSTQMEADSDMADLAIRFLDHGCFVQYTTCSRHPIEFLRYLKREWLKRHAGGDWKTVKQRIVLVDGYTPHFGFTDTVYTEWSGAALEDCLDCIVSPPTFAGIHTAIANAFNKAKGQSGQARLLRAPALVIYEGMHALVDLESDEQYRIFIRHVIPSERLWGGMLTLFVEPSASQENLKVLREITHIFVYKASKDREKVGSE